MGAATCIMYAAKDPSIASLCLDSGFTSLTQLCTDTLKNRVLYTDLIILKIFIKTFGTLLNSMFFKSVRKAIKKKVHFDFE